MKLRKRKKKNLLFFIVLIIINIRIILGYIGDKMMPTVEESVKAYATQSIYNYVFNVFDKEILINKGLQDIIILNMNSKQEIVSVDYNFDVAYSYLNDSLVKLYDNIDKLKLNNMAYFKNNKGIYFVPAGIVYKNLLLDNLGFKIPVMINFISNVRMNFVTRVSDYGINNLLVELYLTIDIQNEIVSPVSFYTFGDDFEMAVASKVVVGSIPSYYGGVIEKSSAIVSS